MKRYIYLATGFILNICNVFSQIELPQITPPYPTSAIYQRYAAMPPNFSTGTVNVSIPLYTLNVNGFMLPFSLNYQTSGIKVLDPFYPLGYGWVLSPGLRISRTIMGNADDRAPRSIRNESEFWQNDTEEKYLYLKSLLINGPAAGNITWKDAQYDIYSLHLPETNVRFVMHKENNVWKAVTIGSTVKINPVLSTDGKFNGFEVKDDQGVTYQFGEVTSYTQPLDFTTPSSTYMEINRQGASAWLLRKIILPGANNTIDFNWNSGKYGSVIPLNDYYSIEDTFWGDVNCDAQYGSQLPEWSYDVSSGSLMNPFPCMYLKEVLFQSGKIEITYDADKFMKNITVYSKPAGTYFLVKNIDFNTVSARPNKLLKNVTIGQEKYTFEYDESHPYISANARDWWGYYNGCDNNLTAIPRLSFTLSYGYGANYPLVIGDANKEIDKYAMQQNILTKVIYPTGGYSMYKYEPHQFNGSIFREGGGLRVVKIITKESDTSQEIVSEYRYGQNESGLGICTMEPVPSSFFQEIYHVVNPFRKQSGPCAHGYRQLILTADSRISGYTAFNPDVWYDVVSEYSQEGKTVYYFDYQMDDPLTLMFHTVTVIPPNPARTMIDCFKNLFKQGPKLRYKKIYKKETSGIYQQVEEEETQYVTKSGSYIDLTGLYVDRKIYYNEYADGIYDYTGDPYYPNGLTMEAFTFKNYKILINTEKVSTLIKKFFDADNIIEQKIDYDYVVQDEIINFASETTVSSDNKTVSMQMLYPLDNLSMLTQEQKATVNKMIESNRLTTPLVETRIAGSSQSVQISQYKDWGNNLLLPEKLYLKTGNGAQELRIIYHNYDSYGNPVYVSKDDATHIVYLWGYKGQYPIAKIENATYDEIKEILGEALINRVADAASPLDSDINSINNLRTNSTLSKAMITTYTYKPLIGMLTATDPHGVVMTYEYDDFGRLKTVKDHNGSVINQYEYHYKN